MFSIDDSASVGKNLTMNRNTFVFTEAGTVSGVNVYTSTAELNSTTATNTVECSDGGAPESLPLNIGNDFYSPYNLRYTNIEGSNVQFEWDTPINAGVCCNQYCVVTSNGIIVTRETSFTMDNASISVSCVDMLGTSGREVVFTPIITSQPVDVSIPEPVGDICSSEVTYRVNFTIPDLGGIFSEIVDYGIMSVTDDDGRSVRYSVVERSARSVTFTLSNRNSFTVTFTFTDELGNNMTRSSSYDTTAINAACNCTCVLCWILLGISVAITIVVVSVISAIMICVLRCPSCNIFVEEVQVEVKEELEVQEDKGQDKQEDKGYLKTDTKM